MNTDTSEKGLETLIYQAVTGRTGLEPVPDAWQEVSPTAAGGTGWLAGWPRDYDRTHALDAPQDYLTELLKLKAGTPTDAVIVSRRGSKVSGCKLAW